MKTLRNRRFSSGLTVRIWLVTSLGVGLMGCDGGANAGNVAKKKLPTVTVEPVRTEPITQPLALTGETVAVESVVIAATVEGPISYCPWREGDRIQKAGDRLIEIDRELYRAEVKAADAALEVAKAKLADLEAGTRPEEIAKAREAVTQLDESTTFAKSDLDRITRLVESGSLSGETLEKARVEFVAEQAKLAAARRHLEMLEAGYTRTAIAVQKAVVNEALAKLDLAKARLGECVILAPFAGTVTRVHVRSGDMAAAKVPLLEIADLSSLVIRVAVPEAHASAVHEGVMANVTLDSLPGKRFAAKIDRVYPQLDRRMRTRTVELFLTEPADLVPGMFARVHLVLQSIESAVTIPSQAVNTTPTGATVAYVISDGKAVMRKVQTGMEQAGRLQILTGLKPGESVVVSGQEKLKDGGPVQVAGAGKPSSQPSSKPKAGDGSGSRKGGAS